MNIAYEKLAAGVGQGPMAERLWRVAAAGRRWMSWEMVFTCARGSGAEVGSPFVLCPVPVVVILFVLAGYVSAD